MRSPVYKPRFREFLEIRDKRILGIRLRRIGRDDFQIATLAEREQCVLRSASWMDAAKRRANAGALFDEGNAAVKIATTEQDVIEQRRHLLCRPGNAWRGHRAAGQN